MSIGSETKQPMNNAPEDHKRSLGTESDSKDKLWNEAHAKLIIEQFTSWSDEIARARIVKDEKAKQVTLAKVASTGSQTGMEGNSSTFNFWSQKDSQTLATDADAFAVSAIAQLRHLAKNKKVRNKDNAASWSVLLQKTTKLTPEGAAEMARATVAAAAAAAAMRQPVEKEISENELVTGARYGRPIRHSVASLQPSASEFDLIPYSNSAFTAAARGELPNQGSSTSPDAVKQKDESLARTSKKKTVGFAADTIFEKPRRR